MQIKWHLKKIPKIAHFYWGDADEHLPMTRYFSVLSFSRKNPNWEIWFHMPEFPSKTQPTWKTQEQKASITKKANGLSLLEKIPNLRIIKHNFKEYGFENDVHEVFKSDFIRWKLLYDCGGLWSDSDIVYLAPMEHSHFNISNNTAANEVMHYCPKTRAFTIGFMLSCDKSILAKKIFDSTVEFFNKEQYQSIGSSLLNNRYSNFDNLQKEFPSAININSDLVYPINCYGIKKLLDKKDIQLSKNTIGCHWFGGHPDIRTFEYSIEEENDIYKKRVFLSTIFKKGLR